jgi:hypothetical protein
MSLSFYIHFGLSFVGFLFLGIYVCRGSWRNSLRAPLPLALMFVSMGHVLGLEGGIKSMLYMALLILGMGLFARAFRNTAFVPSEVRGGHNMFSLLVGAGLFALAVQLHGVYAGVPVFVVVN